jgi:VWFA-related protein
MVEVTTTVRGGDGHLVTDLTREDFQVRVDGRPVAIEIFSNEPRPLAVALLLFTALPAPGNIERQRDAAKALVDHLDPGDVGVIGSMSDEIALSPHITSDKAILYRVLDEELWPGPINAVGTVANLAMEAFATETRKRAVVFIGYDAQDRCDYWVGGQDDPRCVTTTHATRRAEAEGVLIYGLPSPVPFGMNPSRPVRAMSRATGGGYAELTYEEDLRATMARVVEGLRRDYLLGFTPPTRDGRDHRVEVRVTRPGMTTFARRTFRLGGAR